jgi:hypothetical protein
MRDTIPADTLATLVVGNYLSDDDTTPEDTDSGVITAIDQDEDGVVLVRWLTSYGGRREDSLAGVLHCLERNLLRVVVRPICDCPCCHAPADALVSADPDLASECVCIPECIRGEARHLDFASRDALVAWLVENDPQGAHSDEDALREVGRVHTLESAQESFCMATGIHANWAAE